MKIIINDKLTIEFSEFDIDRIDIILCEAEKSPNLCAYDKKFLNELRKILKM